MCRDLICCDEIARGWPRRVGIRILIAIYRQYLRLGETHGGGLVPVFVPTGVAVALTSCRPHTPYIVYPNHNSVLDPSHSVMGLSRIILYHLGALYRALVFYYGHLSLILSGRETSHTAMIQHKADTYRTKVFHHAGLK